LIEKGMPEGHKIVYRSAWEEVPETNPGDLTFILKTVPHPVFVRNGNDLKMKMEISLLESLLGFSKQFTHLDNRIVTVTREEVTIPGQVIMVKDEGMPHHEYPSFKGNLYIEFSIKFPEALTPAQKQGLKKLFQV